MSEPNSTPVQPLQPQPQPQQQPQPPQNVQIPIETIRTIARFYTQFSWLLPIISKVTGQKIPPELDQAMYAIAASDNPNAVQNLQNLASGQPYDLQELDIKPRIGEPVLTKDLAWRAWELHNKQGLSLREIAAYFTEELGAPCSHATVASYINEIDDTIEESRGARTKTILKALGLVSIPLAVGLVGYFLGKLL